MGWAVRVAARTPSLLGRGRSEQEGLLWLPGGEGLTLQRGNRQSSTQSRAALIESSSYCLMPPAQALEWGLSTGSGSL